jgi:hypothetical protein
MDTCTIGAIASAIVALIGLAAWILYMRKAPTGRRRAVGNIAWLAHVLVLGASCLIFDPGHQKPAFEVWCSAVKLHGIIQVAADGLFTLARWYRFQRLVRRAIHE